MIGKIASRYRIEEKIGDGERESSISLRMLNSGDMWR